MADEPPFYPTPDDFARLTDELVPWDDPEMRFALMSVVVAARMWAHDEPRADDLLRAAVAHCEAEVEQWHARRA